MLQQAPAPRFQRRSVRPYGLQWSTSPFTLAITAAGVAGQQSVNLSTNLEVALGRNLGGTTIMRMRGSFILIAGGTPAAGPTQVFLGAGIFSSGIDNADFPDLSTGAGNWMYYQAAQVSESGAATTNQILPVNAPFRFEIDVKAKRKFIGNDQDLLLVGQIATTDNDITVFGSVRTLVKIP